METLACDHVEVLWHTLGLSIDRREPYRNHFVAGLGHHCMLALDALEAQGLMQRVRSPAFLEKSDILFMATDAGRELAIASLPPEPKRTRYDEFCRSGGEESFGEFLCGWGLPKVEVDGGASLWHCSITKYRMYREKWDEYQGIRREVQGEWRETKKDAKASYKEALATHNKTLKSLLAQVSEQGAPIDDEVQDEGANEQNYN